MGVDRWQEPSRFLRMIEDEWFSLVVALQDRVSVATTAYWSGRGLKTMHLPITTHSVSSPMGLGSDSMPVRVDLFGVPTYLADSMQFMLEYGCRLWPGGAYYLMPSFRGESADETHLCQFFHSEVEIPGGLDDVMAAAEDYLRFLCADLLSTLGDNIRRHVGNLAHIESVPFGKIERLTFDEAAVALGGDPAFIRVDPKGWRTITRPGERRLMDLTGGPVWVTNFDHMAVPFYQAYADDDRRLAANADLLLGLGEVIGSGERHASGDSVRDSLEAHRVPQQPYQWYIDMKTAYPMRTAGFGMGVERFLAWVLRHNDIRDLQVLPRFNGIVTTP